MAARYGVMGNPIAHSLSPQIHQAFAKEMSLELHYEKILVELGCFSRQVNDFFMTGGQGLNITLPFKEEAYDLAQLRTPRCEQAKAANTLWMRDGVLYADNTDGIGLIRDLARHINLSNQRILILGAGGAARGIIGPLLDASIASLSIMNRTPERALALQKDFPMIQCVSADSRAQPSLSHRRLTDMPLSFDVVINATSIASHQSVWNWPIHIQLHQTFCYDLYYTLDGVTPFVEWVLHQGGQALDGLGMLVEQAAEAFFIWHGVFPNATAVLSSLR